MITGIHDATIISFDVFEKLENKYHIIKFV